MSLGNPFYSHDELRKWKLLPPEKKGARTKVLASAERPFIGIDGEGAGVDELGRQKYLLLCAKGRGVNRELYTGDHLKTGDCLNFILKLPADVILVGFSFGYDTTMILRDLPDERRARLLRPLDPNDNLFQWVYWQSFAIQYLPKQHLKVARTARIPGTEKLRIVKGSARTIYEVFGFFQASFLKTLKNFEVTDPATLAMIEKNKGERGSFDEAITDEIRHYCRTECQLLADTMSKLRDACTDAGIHPRTWNGAGKLAKALHKDKATPKRKEIATIPPEVWEMAGQAYYGGRFEVTKIGHIPGPIYEYDINSAYPASMLSLPCVLHGRWHKVHKRPSPGSLYVAELSFCFDVEKATRDGTKFHLGGFPIRQKTGGIYWPGQGQGVYWSVEIEAAERLGFRTSVKHAWVYRSMCDCKPFSWVESLYCYRKILGKSAKGYPIKLGINSLYGTLAQRIGKPVYGNYVWAGLITAATRAMLMRAATQAPDQIVMMATDGIYSLAPLDLPVGGDLGQWEAATHDHLFIVQPGLYWGPPKPKTRGVPVKFFEHRTAEFETVWREFYERQTADHAGDVFIDYPEPTIDLTSFIGLKLAQARGKPDTAGRWVTAPRRLSFDWSRKRMPGAIYEHGHAVTSPLPGSHGLRSVYYKSIDPAVVDRLDAASLDLEEQPDYVDLSPPWTD